MKSDKIEWKQMGNNKMEADNNMPGEWIEHLNQDWEKVLVAWMLKSLESFMED